MQNWLGPAIVPKTIQTSARQPPTPTQIIPSTMSRQQQQQQQIQARLNELRREEALLQQQLAIQEYAGSYEISLQWPATVVTSDTTATNTSQRTRTNHDLIQHRLLEAGLLYEVPIPTVDAVAAASALVHNLESSDCFHAVRVQIGGPAAASEHPHHHNDDNNDSTTLRTIQVQLHEKQWYRLHAGAGLKTDAAWLGGGGSSGPMGSSSGSGSTDSFLPLAEVDVSVGLRNVAGCLDRTDVQYALDTHNMSTWNVTHARPLYTLLPNAVSDLLLEQTIGSQCSFFARAGIEPVDHTGTSSYQLFQRLLKVKAATMPEEQRHDGLVKQKQPWYASLEWGVVHRDLVPRRHGTLPYHLDAAPEIVAQAGPTLKHSVTAVLQYDSTHYHAAAAATETEAMVADQSRLPVRGVQLRFSSEVATPPGDVGFVKNQADAAAQVSLTDRLALHGSIATGFLYKLSFGGLCNTPAIVSDKFLLGGCGSFRGFVPAGIGPRAAGKRNLGGNALGGNFFYTATAMASISPAIATTNSLEPLSGLARHLRLFGFATAGTCVNANMAAPGWQRNILGSTRASAGFGIATQAIGPARVEATYSWPIRYGPCDGRRRFQFGMSFSL